MLLHLNNAKNHYKLYGRACADPENFSRGGERVEGIFMFPGGGLRHIFGKFKKFGVFSPPPRLTSQDFRMGEQFEVQAEIISIHETTICII